MSPGETAKKPPSASGEATRPISRVGRTHSGLSDDGHTPRVGFNVSWDENMSDLLAGPNSRIGGAKPASRVDSVDFISPLKSDVTLLRGLLFDVVRSQVPVETMDKLEIIAKLSADFDVEAEDATFTTIAGTIGNLSEEELLLVRFGVPFFLLATLVGCGLPLAWLFSGCGLARRLAAAVFAPLFWCVDDGRRSWGEGGRGAGRSWVTD